jgi:uncharacterized protein (TIGR00255 family)
VAGRRATVEIRSVNHRFFDLKLRAPWIDPGIEERISHVIRQVADRGAFSVTLREEGIAQGARVWVDTALAQSIAGALEELRLALADPNPVPLALVAQQPGVINLGEGGVRDPDVVFAVVQPALATALHKLVDMRRQEGAALAADLGRRFGHLSDLVNQVNTLAAASPEEWRRRLTERLQKLLAPTNVALDERRLANEVAILADRLDVTEEVVRLCSHLFQAQALLAKDEPAGRRLDFLIQEISREVNTIGSKAQSAEIVKHVVEAKAELEKIREQVQNVE